MSLLARIRRPVILPLAAFCLLAGCSGEPQDAKENDNEIDQTVVAQGEGESKETNSEAFLQAPKAPTHFTEIQNTHAGPLSGVPFLEQVEANQQELDQFPPLSETASPEELEAYWNKLVSLYSESYPDPGNLLIQNSYGDPNSTDSRFQLKENYNVEILLDASGSMAGKIGGQTKMDIAKNAIREFIGSLPEEAKVGLRVYGHKGSNQPKDKDLSCSSSELMISFEATNRSELDTSLGQFQATGWTPIAKALEDAANDLSAFDEKQNTNVIILVSDGVETCGGDPVAVAKKLKDSTGNPFVHVIGFDVDQAGQQQLKQVAQALDGLYSNVNNPVQLEEQFNQTRQNAKRWADHLISSNQEAFDIKKKNYDDLNAWRFQNNDLNEREAANLREAIGYLKKSNILSLDQQLALEKKVFDRQRIIIEEANTLWNDLIQKNSQNYLKIIDDNAKKFKENTTY